MTITVFLRLELLICHLQYHVDVKLGTPSHLKSRGFVTCSFGNAFSFVLSAQLDV